jgi:hypothetical protein
MLSPPLITHTFSVYLGHCRQAQQPKRRLVIASRRRRLVPRGFCISSRVGSAPRDLPVLKRQYSHCCICDARAPAPCGVNVAMTTALLQRRRRRRGNARVCDALERKISVTVRKEKDSGQNGDMAQTHGWRGGGGEGGGRAEAMAAGGGGISSQASPGWGVGTAIV